MVESPTQLDRIEAKLDRLDTHGREHGLVLAGHIQWIESHGQVHKTQDKRLDSLSQRVNIVAGVNGMLALIAGALGVSPRSG